MVKRLWQRLKDRWWCKTHEVCYKHLRRKEWVSSSTLEHVDQKERSYGKTMCDECFKEWAARAKVDASETRLVEIRKRRGLEW